MQKTLAFFYLHHYNNDEYLSWYEILTFSAHHRRKNMHIPSGFIIREVAGETVAIPTGEASKNLSGLVALSGCGRFLFELLYTEQTEQSLVDALLETYDVTPATAQADVAEFLGILRENGILIEK